MSRKKRSTRTRRTVDIRDRSLQPAVPRKRVRPYRDVRVDLPVDFHHPYRRRSLTYRQLLKEDPRIYDEAYLQRASTPLPKPPPLYTGRRPVRQKVYDPAFCRRQKKRRQVMAALGFLGASGGLPRSIRRRRARRYRDTNNNRIKC